MKWSLCDLSRCWVGAWYQAVRLHAGKRQRRDVAGYCCNLLSVWVGVWVEGWSGPCKEQEDAQVCVMRFGEVQLSAEKSSVFLSLTSNPVGSVDIVDILTRVLGNWSKSTDWVSWRNSQLWKRCCRSRLRFWHLRHRGIRLNLGNNCLCQAEVRAGLGNWVWLTGGWWLQLSGFMGSKLKFKVKPLCLAAGWWRYHRRCWSCVCAAGRSSSCRQHLDFLLLLSICSALVLPPAQTPGVGGSERRKSEDPGAVPFTRGRGRWCGSAEVFSLVA